MCTLKFQRTFWGQKIISDHVGEHYKLLVVSKRPIFMLHGEVRIVIMTHECI